MSGGTRTLTWMPSSWQGQPLQWEGTHSPPHTICSPSSPITCHRRALLSKFKVHQSLVPQCWTDTFFELTDSPVGLLHQNLWLRKRLYENGDIEWSLKDIKQLDKDSTDALYVEFRDQDQILSRIASSNLVSTFPLALSLTIRFQL